MVIVAIVASSALSACGPAGVSSAAPSSAAIGEPSTVDGSGSSALRPRGPTETGARVIRVVDGDTLHVDVDGKDVDVRMIGINTPETVKPDSPIECYGPEASAYAKKLLSGATVTIEYDDSQGRTDRFGRTLAYVWIERPEGKVLFNRLAVLNGYAYQYQYARPYAWEREFIAAQRKAKAAKAGMWGACSR